MKKLIAVLGICILFAACEKLTDKCYVCETRTEIGTTLETSTTYEVTGIISVRDYERENSSVVVKNLGAGPYYSQTITKCREK